MSDVATGQAPNENALQRFVDAQNPCFADVLEELRAGSKTTHWMWFVFPQILGLGKSEMAIRYAFRSLDEARAYAAHPVLGERLRMCTQIVNATEGRTAHDIFGEIDSRKFQSSMTLFLRALKSTDVEDGDKTAYALALDKYFAGAEDAGTLEIIGGSNR